MPLVFSWTFEGGTPATSSDPNPVVTYNEAGVFSVTLTASNAAGESTFSQQDYITVGELPEASFAYENVEGELLVNFTNNSTNADSFNWDFGDGQNSDETNPSYTYAAGGNYTVVLSATNSCGTVTSVQLIDLLIPPTAGFNASSTDGCTPFTVQFSDTSLGSVTSWLWTFEGGTPASSTEQNPSVTYNNAGIFDVSLVVTNAAGESSSVQNDYITVGSLPAAAFSFDYTLGETVVNFSNTSTNADSYNWDFGNGEMSTAISPSHNFGTDGTYTVTLTATNGCGSVTTTETITIITIPIPDFSAAEQVGCVPFTVTFNDESTTNATNWDWSFEGGVPANSTEQNPTVTYNSVGTFAVQLEVSNAAGAQATTVQDFITVQGAPSVNFASLVNDLQVTFNNLTEGANGFSWDFGDNNSSMLVNPIHTYETDGTYDVILTAFNDCDTVEFTKSVTVGSLPNAAFTSSAVEGCTPLSITFTDQSSDNTTGWNWVFEGGLPATSTEQNPEVLYLEAGVFSVTLVASNQQGSSTIVQESYITVGQGATANFGATVNNSTATFTNLSTFADSYLWDFGDGNTSTEINPVHTYQEDGTYVVSLIASNACGDVIITKEIIIISLPVAGFDLSTDSGCVPLEVTFSDASTSNVDTWQWNFVGGIPATSTEANPTVTYQTPGSYDVVLYVFNEAGSDTIIQENAITVQPFPEADFNFEVDGTMASFSNLSLFAEDYNWDFGNGMMSTLENPEINFEEDGIYEVSLTISNDCGEETITKTITIVTPPTAAFNSEETTGCVPFTIQFFNQSSNNTTSLKWTFEGGSPSTSTANNPIVTYNTPGSYTVALQALNSAGESTQTIEDYITILNDPDADFIPDINGFDVTFFDNSIFATSYQWDFGDGFGSTESNPQHTYEDEGEFEVTLIISNLCGQDTVMKTVTIDSNFPFAGFTADSTVDCAPLEVQFINQSSENSTNFEWTFEGGSPASSTQINPLVSYASPGIYQVTLVASNAAGSDAVTKFEFIEVLAAPTASFTFEVNGFEVSFTNASADATEYTWNFGDDSSSNEVDVVHTFAPALSYVVELIASNACGVDTISQEVFLEGVAPAPAFESNLLNGCAPLTVQFTDLSMGDPLAWNWFFPGASPASSQEQDPEVVYPEPGLYPVTLQVSNPFGEDSLTIEQYVEVIGLPDATFSFEQEDLKVVFEPTMLDTSLNYLWLFGDGNQSTEQIPTHTYEMPGMYTAQLIITNECGSDTSSQAINLIIDNVSEEEWLESVLLFPNPNGGDFSIEIRGPASETLVFRVLNILGQQFYEGNANFQSGLLQEQIHLPSKAAGVYLLEIKSDTRLSYRKFIVK